MSTNHHTRARRVEACVSCSGRGGQPVAAGPCFPPYGIGIPVHQCRDRAAHSSRALERAQEGLAGTPKPWRTPAQFSLLARRKRARRGVRRSVRGTPVVQNPCPRFKHRLRLQSDQSSRLPSVIRHISRAPRDPFQEAGRTGMRTLDFGGRPRRTISPEWLLDHLTGDTLRSLRLPLIGVYDSRLKDLLAHVGHNLQHLEVGCPNTSAGHVQDIHDDTPTSLSSLLDLSSCTSLQTLSLTIPTYRDAGFITRWLVTLLVQVASSPLEELRFAIHPILRADVADASAMLAAFDWNHITRVLLGHGPNTLSQMCRTREVVQAPSRARAGRFMSLRKVTFYAGQAADYVHIPSAFVPLAPYLRKLASTSFHPLQEKGIQVCFEP